MEGRVRKSSVEIIEDYCDPFSTYKGKQSLKTRTYKEEREVDKKNYKKGKKNKIY